MGYKGLGQSRSGTLRIGGRKQKSAGGGGPGTDSGQKASGTPKLQVGRGKSAGGVQNFAQLGQEVRGYRKFSGGGSSTRSVSASKVKKGTLGGA